MTRILAISDIHGHALAFKTLLYSAHFDPMLDQLILLGDYIGNGGENHHTLQLIEQLVDIGTVALLGNHEQRLIEQHTCINPSLTKWISFLKSLNYWYEEQSYLFVHAGIQPGIPIQQQKFHDIISIRETFHKDKLTTLDKTVVFGHTPTHRLGANIGDLWLGTKKIGIDTGANHGQYLSLVDLNNRMQYKLHVNQHIPVTVTF